MRSLKHLKHHSRNNVVSLGPTRTQEVGWRRCRRRRRKRVASYLLCSLFMRCSHFFCCVFVCRSRTTFPQECCGGNISSRRAVLLPSPLLVCLSTLNVSQLLPSHLSFSLSFCCAFSSLQPPPTSFSLLTLSFCPPQHSHPFSFSFLSHTRSISHSPFPPLPSPLFFIFQPLHLISLPPSLHSSLRPQLFLFLFIPTSISFLSLSFLTHSRGFQTHSPSLTNTQSASV